MITKKLTTKIMEWQCGIFIRTAIDTKTRKEYINIQETNHLNENNFLFFFQEMVKQGYTLKKIKPYKEFQQYFFSRGKY
jgi:hypothetical protein